MSPKKKVNKDQKTKKETPKTIQTAPTPSESTPIFVKRITGSRYLSPYPTKYNMSPKDWDKAFEMLKTMQAEK